MRRTVYEGPVELGVEGSLHDVLNWFELKLQTVPRVNRPSVRIDLHYCEDREHSTLYAEITYDPKPVHTRAEEITVVPPFGSGVKLHIPHPRPDRL